MAREQRKATIIPASDHPPLRFVRQPRLAQNEAVATRIPSPDFVYPGFSHSLPLTQNASPTPAQVSPHRHRRRTLRYLWGAFLILLGLTSSLLAGSLRVIRVGQAVAIGLPLILCAPPIVQYHSLAICHTYSVENYASYAAGARHIETLSSPAKTHSSYIRKTQSYMNLPATKPCDPAVVLQSSPNNLTFGHCWPMNGTQGHYGLSFAQPIRLTEITVSHKMRSTPEDLGFTAAPREMVLWGLLRNTEMGGIGQTILTSRWLFDHSLLDGTHLPQAEAGHSLVPIAQLVYEKNGTVTQSFTPNNPYIWRYFDVDTVILEIKNNWGDSHKTCLYNLQIFGFA